jgi:hypothetical protein
MLRILPYAHRLRISINAAFVYIATDKGTCADGAEWQAVYCVEAYA